MNVDLRIGPCATQDDLNGKREIIPYSSNKTASYVSNIFLGNGFLSPTYTEDDFKKKPYGSFGSFKLDKDSCKLPVENISTKNYPNCDFKIVATWIREDIKNHIEVRLQLFLMQIMSLYNTSIKVHKFRTQAQAGDKNKSASGNPLEPTEVHAGTLPNLIGNRKEEEENSYFTDQTECKPRVFAKGTTFYHQANITHKLPRFVNDVDSNIDFRTSELEYMCETFREQSVNILNYVSTDPRMTPQTAFRNFLIRLHKKLNQLYSGSVPYQQSVLEYYNEVILSYLKQNEDANFIKRLMFDPNLDLPAITRTLNQKIHFELTLLSKIAEIQQSATRYLNGANFFDETMKCLLTLGTDTGRLAILQDKTSNLSDTAEEYVEEGLKLDSITTFAQAIINSDHTLPWVDSLFFIELPYFVQRVKTDIAASLHKTTIQNSQAIALRILWNIAIRTLPLENNKLTTFLCFSTADALPIMKKHPVIRRNVQACLKDETIKRLLAEFTQLLALPIE